MSSEHVRSVCPVASARHGVRRRSARRGAGRQSTRTPTPTGGPAHPHPTVTRTLGTPPSIPSFLFDLNIRLSPTVVGGSLCRRILACSKAVRMP